MTANRHLYCDTVSLFSAVPLGMGKKSYEKTLLEGVLLTVTKEMSARGEAPQDRAVLYVPLSGREDIRIRPGDVIVKGDAEKPDGECYSVVSSEKADSCPEHMKYLKAVCS